MRLILSFILAMQMALSSALAQTGERSEFSPAANLKKSIAVTEAAFFEQSMRSILKKVILDPSSELKRIGPLPESDQLAFKKILAQAGPIGRSLKEKSPGVWLYRSAGQKVSFTLLDLYQSQVWVNGKILKFKDVPFSKLEWHLGQLEGQHKTTYLIKFLQQLIGIDSAHAVLPVIIVAVVAVAILGYSVWKFSVKPEQTVTKLKEITETISKQAASCQVAHSDPNQYKKTFELASSVGDRASYNSTSSSEIMQYILKNQLSSGMRSNGDCFRIMDQAGDNLGVDIPIPSPQTMQQLEAGIKKAISKTDVPSAVFNLCQAYNALGSCMETFVAHHIDDSGVDLFKGLATDNFSRYKRKSGKARAQ